MRLCCWGFDDIAKTAHFLSRHLGRCNWELHSIISIFVQLSLKLICVSFMLHKNNRYLTEYFFVRNCSLHLPSFQRDTCYSDFCCHWSWNCILWWRRHPQRLCMAEGQYSSFIPPMYWDLRFPFLVRLGILAILGIKFVWLPQSCIGSKVADLFEELQGVFLTGSAKKF